MRWKGRSRSENVEDRRGSRGMQVAGGGGLILFVIAIIAILMGQDPRPLLNVAEQVIPQDAGQLETSEPIDDEAREFIEVVLKDTEEVWTRLFREQLGGRNYPPPKLVIFSNATMTGCGRASAATGPFYCPADKQVYIDPMFFDELASKLNSPGDFAQAYVIAHEVAHHVQNELGLMNSLNRARARGAAAANRESVRVELQADYLAGVWAHHAQKHFKILEQGDIEEAVNAANQIGDDTLQQMSTGYVIPERFTHGTSAQRVRWFKEGLLTGDLNGCQRLMEIDYERLAP